MALKNEFTDAKEAATTTSKKNSPKGYMSWEVINPDGSPLVDKEGRPMLRSEGTADLTLFGVDGYNKSKAEQKLIKAAKMQADKGEVLELTFKVKIKYYDPTPVVETNDDDLFTALGVL